MARTAGADQWLRAAVWRSEKALVADPSSRAEHYSTFAAREAPAAESHSDTMIGMPIRRIIAESGFKNIDLLKVDVEGHEREVLEGFRVALESGAVDVVQFEFTLWAVIASHMVDVGSTLRVGIDLPP